MRRAYNVSATILILAMLASCVALDKDATPTTRWVSARDSLSQFQNQTGRLHDAGVLDDEDIVVIDHGVQAARVTLQRSFWRLPEGGSDFDTAMDALDSVLDVLVRMESDNPKARIAELEEAMNALPEGGDP